jgi:hypothetical protein
MIQLYFIDSRKPRYLLIINFEDIETIHNNEKNITSEILNNDLKGKVNYNSFQKIINFTDKSKLEMITTMEVDKKKSKRLFEISLKSNIGKGNMFVRFPSTSYSYQSEECISFSVEIIKNIKKRYYAGVGFIYQLATESGLKSFNWHNHDQSNSFHNNPVYVLFRLNILENENFPDFYTVLNLGYNKIWGSIFPDDFEIKGGLYSGFGLGLQYNQIIFESYYKNFGSSFIGEEGEDEGIDFNSMHFEIISFSVGYIFK